MTTQRFPVRTPMGTMVLITVGWLGVFAYLGLMLTGGRRLPGWTVIVALLAVAIVTAIMWNLTKRIRVGGKGFIVVDDERVTVPDTSGIPEPFLRAGLAVHVVTEQRRVWFFGIIPLHLPVTHRMELTHGQRKRVLSDAVFADKRMLHEVVFALGGPPPPGQKRPTGTPPPSDDAYEQQLDAELRDLDS